MAQVDIRARDAATYLGVQASAIGTAPTFTRAFPVVGSFDVSGIEQAHLANMDESVNLYDHRQPVLGLKAGRVKFDYYCKAVGGVTGRLDASGATATHPLGIALNAMFGSENAAVGSLVVAAGSTATIINVSVGTGANFPAGTIIAVEVTAGNYELTRVITRATDALTLRPILSAPPGDGLRVVNSYTYAPTENNAQSLGVRRALAGGATDIAAYEWQMLGCIGKAKLTMQRNELMKWTFDLECATWTGPTAAGYSIAAATESTTAPFAVTGSTLTLFQLSSDLTRTAYALKSVETELDFGMGYSEELGGTEGKTTAFRSKGGRPFGKATVRFRADRVIDDTNWTNQNDHTLFCAATAGATTAQRWAGFDMPSAEIVGKPKMIEDGEQLWTELALESKTDTTTTGTATDRSRSPVRFFLI